MATRPASIESGSPERFGYEWKTYSEMRPEYEEQFRRWTVLIPLEEWKGKAILDVGCGMGRNSFWPLAYGASSAVAIDVDDDSVTAARHTLARFKNATVRKMSAYDMDYADHFDIVFSIGVIHHLEAPGVALREMVDALKPGGKLLIWVYGLDNNRWLLWVLDPARKLLFSRLPAKLTHHLSLYPTALLWLGLRLGIGRIEYFRLLQRMTFRHLRSIVFDQMLPRIANYWPREAVEALLIAQELIDVHVVSVNQMSWCAVGRKPV